MNLLLKPSGSHKQRNTADIVDPVRSCDQVLYLHLSIKVSYLVGKNRWRQIYGLTEGAPETEERNYCWNGSGKPTQIEKTEQVIQWINAYTQNYSNFVCMFTFTCTRFIETNHMKFLCRDNCFRYSPRVTGFSGEVKGAGPTLSLKQHQKEQERGKWIWVKGALSTSNYCKITVTHSLSL